MFLDDQDKARFLDTLYLKSKDSKCFIYAYCLMNNHVHLLINEGSDSIGRIMKRINVSYASYFNKKYQRVGHLFQDRFKSEIIDTDGYLFSAARYIHNNPVKAGISPTPEGYAWSSYNLYTDRSKPSFNIVDTDFLLDMYSSNTVRARKLMMEYTLSDNDDEFIDFSEEQATDRSIGTRQEAEEFIQEYIGERLKSKVELKLKENIKIRNELISELKRRSYLSIRELAEILDLDRNIIQRAE